jgi:tRNA A-37 threonylcarbamoyl transferase component Bud32
LAELDPRSPRNSRGPRGRSRILAANEELSAAAADLVTRWASCSLAGSANLTFAGLRAVLRWDVLEKSAPFASAWRSMIGLGSIPRVREYTNLVWLAERLFQTPRPLAAGVSTSGSVPGFQFIVCEEIEGAVSLDAFLRASGRAEDAPPAPAPQRSGVLTELAREVARMHALRFVHGDLTTAHVLVGPASCSSRIHFSDPSRGGPRLSTRGALGDMAQLIECVHGTLTEPEIRGLLATYVEERRAQGRAIDAARLTREIEKRSEALGH